MPALSVIMPVYNAGEHLRPCLESILAQSFCDYELILVMDGSTDESEAVCATMAAQDARIRLIKNQEKLHIGYSRNVGLDAATGKYLLFSDDDDLWEKEAFEVLYKTIEKEKADAVLSWVDCCDGKPLVHDNVLILGAIYRRTPLRFIDTRVMSAEDLVYNAEFMHAHPHVVHLSRVLYHHLNHATSEGHQSSYMGYEKRGKAMEYMLEHVPHTQWLYDELNRQWIRLLANALFFSPGRFGEVKKYLHQAEWAQQAIRHYALPRPNRCYKRIVRKWFIWVAKAAR